MKNKKNFSLILLIVVLVTMILASQGMVGAATVGGRAKPEGAGNNLSYPVIWAEGVPKVLRGAPGMAPQLNGVFWYWWGTAADGTPLSCQSNPVDTTVCLDNTIPPDNAVKAYPQKDEYNIWQAGSADGSSARIVPEWLDWGDNLESVDWYTRSMVRTEVVLIKDVVPPMLEYTMRHLSGWGATELWGLSTLADGTAETASGAQATVYSPCARLTLQKLYVTRDDSRLAHLVWVPGEGWKEPLEDPDNPGNTYPYDLINDKPLFNSAVHEAKDGPGYYSAEINVKGKIIYGYTWNVRRLNEGAGDYRATFSFDAACPDTNTPLNTFFTSELGEPVTQILVPVEEVEVVDAALSRDATQDEGGDTGGGMPIIDYDNNLTYIDIRILQRGGGKR